MSLITTSNEIANLCNKLKNEKFICVDTEFIREKYYYCQLLFHHLLFRILVICFTIQLKQKHKGKHHEQDHSGHSPSTRFQKRKL